LIDLNETLEAENLNGDQLPICLDTGTSTQKYLDDPLYIGTRRARPDTEEVWGDGHVLAAAHLILPCKMDVFMQEFMEGMRDIFPQLLVQFEDFSTDNAFRYLDMFRGQQRCFNDDACRRSLCVIPVVERFPDPRYRRGGSLWLFKRRSPCL